MTDVNPQHAKRARGEGSSSDHSFVSHCGMGVTERLKEFASNTLGRIYTSQFKEALVLRKALRSASSAVAKMQSASDKDQVVSSLQLRSSPAFKAILEIEPALAADLKGIEHRAHHIAFRKRQADMRFSTTQLEAIASGAAFLTAAEAALQLRRFTAGEAAIIQGQINNAAEDFALALKLKFLQFDEADAKAAAAKKRREEDREVQRMEVEQQPSRVIMQRMVEAAVAKRLGRSTPSARRASPSPRHVTFAKGKQPRNRSTSRSQSRGRSNSRGPSRGPSRSTSRSATRPTSRGPSRERPQTPFPNRGKGQQRRRPPRDGGGPSTRPPYQGRSPPSGPSRQPRGHAGHGPSRGNGKGGRGTRPHRPPSGMHGGSGRVDGGDGSRTELRR